MGYGVLTVKLKSSRKLRCFQYFVRTERKTKGKGLYAPIVHSHETRSYVLSCESIKYNGAITWHHGGQTYPDLPSASANIQ
jgi:hypothetical protein